MADLFPFQRDAVRELLGGKHIIRADCGTGKTPISLVWADEVRKKTGKRRLVVWTTASKSKTSDFEDEADKFAPNLKPNLDSFEVVSWHMAKKWCNEKTYDEMQSYIFIADELQRAKQGVSSLMGKAFLMLTKYTEDWAGFTGTPGDTWLDYYPYFQACGKVRNKTAFKREFCIEQRYPFPKILAYTHEPMLKQWWEELSFTPDSSSVMGQLPPLTHQIIKVPAPKGYKKVLKTSTTLDGEFLDSNMALLHELRQMCATPDKLSALSDILQSLSSPLVIFCNYTCEREQILGLAKKLGRKVWRIDGERHEMPTAKTIGEKDIILCHYLSGSEALNLQFCNYWLSYSYNYSYSITKQAMGRIRRVGQARHQHYYWLRCEHTIEDEVAKALNNKQDFVEDLWSPERR